MKGTVRSDQWAQILSFLYQGHEVITKNEKCFLFWLFRTTFPTRLLHKYVYK